MHSTNSVRSAQSLRARLLCAFAVLLCGMLLLRGVSAEEAQNPAAGEPEKWLEMLEKGDFDQRKSAVKKLEALGDKARPALEKARRENDSPEIRDTVDRLLAGMQRARLVIEAIDSNGKPIPGAEGSVTVQSQHANAIALPEEEPKPVLIKTDAAGRFVINDVAPGTSYLNVQWQKFQPVFAEGLFVSNLAIHSGENRLRYVLQNGGTVSGKILSAENDAPLEASVTLLADFGQDFKSLDLDDSLQSNELVISAITATCDKTGQFSFEHVPTGRFLVIARQPEFVTASAGVIRVEENGRVQIEAPLRLVSKAKARGTLRLKFFNAHSDLLKTLEGNNDLLKNTTLHGTLQRVPTGTDADAQNAELKMMLQREVMGNNQREGHTITIDEEGLAEVKDLCPGTYWLTLHPEQGGDVTYHAAALVVEAGKPTAITELRPVKMGEVSGVVSAARGKLGPVAIWALNWGDPEAALILSDLTRFQTVISSRDEQGGTMVTTDEQGKFDFQKLLPGRYSFCVYRESVLGVIHNIDVSAGKKTVVPTFKLSGPATQNANFKSKGIVLLPDGKGAENASIMVMNKSGSSSGFNTGEDGAFDIDMGGTGTAPMELMVTLPGYKPFHLNLTTPGIDLASLRITLEKQLYGSIAVTVRDAAGRPLKGARVEPGKALSGIFYPGNGATARKAMTDSAGKCTLKGLGAGPRDFQAVLDGYYVAKPVTITIPPNAEATAEIVLKPGFKVAGSVELPPGIEPANVLVCLQNLGDDVFKDSVDLCHVASVDAKGRFEFNGVRPGKVKLFGQHPGLITQHADKEFDFEITEQPAELKCVLVRAGGIKIELEPEAKGTFHMLKTGTWNPATDTKSAELFLKRLYEQGFVSPGQGETNTLIPGRYDLLVTTFMLQELDSLQQNTASRLIRMATVYPGIDVAALQAGADLTTQKSLRLTAPDSSAEVAGKVTLKIDSPWQTDEAAIGYLGLTIVGERAVAEVEFSISEGLDPACAIAETGTRPPHFSMEKPGEFIVYGLPAGEYKMYCDFESYEGQAWQWRQTRIPSERKMIQSFTVGKGQHVQLGDVVIELPAAIRKRMREQYLKQAAALAEMSYGNAANSDEGAEFQP